MIKSKPTFIYLALAIIFIIKIGGAKDIIWTKKGGGTSYDAGNAVAVNDSGHCYVTGYFQGTTYFGSDSLVSKGALDIYIAKYDSNGVLIWLERAGGSDNDEALDIAVDDSGNCFITGYFEGTAIFNRDTVTSHGFYDGFVAKYNSNGEVQWATSGGGAIDDDGSNSIATDVLGNCYITGYFEDSMTFDTTILVGKGFSDIFIAKFDGSGALQWVVQAGGVDNDVAYGISTDGFGNCYVTGAFLETAYFGNDSLTSSGQDNGFIVKYNTAGSFQWAKQIISNTSALGTSIAVDDNNNVFLSGYFEDTVMVGTTSLLSNGLTDAFIANYTVSGMVQWVRHGGGTGEDQGMDICSDELGNCYMTGNFSGEAFFNNDTLSSNGLTDAMMIKYDSAGTLIWSQQSNATSNAKGQGVTANNNGFCYFTGIFDSTTTFGNDTFQKSGFDDLFISRLSPKKIVGFTSPALITGELLVYPNPNYGQFGLQLYLNDPEKFNLFIYNILGKIVYERTLDHIPNERVQIDLSDRPKGLYFLMVRSKKEVHLSKIVLQ